MLLYGTSVKLYDLVYCIAILSMFNLSASDPHGFLFNVHTLETLMTTTFPRVTYSNIGVDLTPLHDYLDAEIPQIKKTMLGQHWPNLIGGVESELGDRYDVKSPIDNTTVMGSFVSATTQAVEQAVAQARKAFPQWSSTPWQQRVERLREWANHIEKHKYELAVVAIAEVAKSRSEALGEVEEVLDMIRYYCDEMERNDGYTCAMRQAFENEKTRNVLRPIGVFGVIAPFNFPLALSVGMMTGALLGGNTVVFKPAPNSALTGHLLVRYMREAKLLDAVSIVAGHDETGKSLTSHPDISGIAFTGSHDVGMSIFRALSNSSYAKPVLAEMGGKNPAYVMASADIKAAAQGVARSAYGLQGQKCSACSVVYVDRRVKEAFLQEFDRFVESLRIGNPEDRTTFMGPLYDQDAVDRYDHVIAVAKEQKQLIKGGKIDMPAALEQGHYRLPALIEVPAGDPLTKDELFAPILALRTIDSLDEALTEGNAVEYGLTAGIYTKDENELQTFLDNAQAGALYANRPHGATTGAWPGIQSFCGWKGSGISQKGGLGPHYVTQFMREQSHTLM